MSIYITGMGAVSALGGNLSEHMEHLRTLSDGAEPIQGQPPQLLFPAPVPHGTTEHYRTIDLLIPTLEEALASAKLTETDFHGHCAVSYGTTASCYINDQQFHQKLRKNVVDEKSIRAYFACNPAEFIRKRLSINGPALTISNACASGADAIGAGMCLIKSGQCDIVIVGGAEELHPVSAGGFFALGVSSKERCRPFDRNRSGLNLGEAAATLILESEESVRRRGVKPIIELAGYGNANDTFHVTQPSPEGEGLELAIRMAFRDAGLADISEIAFINAHGTGTIHNDLMESIVFNRIFGKGCRFHSTKGLTGHTLGAAGALEAVMSALMLESGLACASYGFSTPDPEMPLSPLTEPFQFNNRRQSCALSTSIAFGGCNSAILLRLPQDGGAI